MQVFIVKINLDGPKCEDKLKQAYLWKYWTNSDLKAKRELRSKFWKQAP